MQLDGKIPSGALKDKWDRYRFKAKLVNPANKRKYKLIVVGSGLAGGAAAATLAELGYDEACFCIQDSPLRAHSIAAQGGCAGCRSTPHRSPARPAWPPPHPRPGLSPPRSGCTCACWPD